MIQAALGTQVAFEGVDSQLQVDIPAGTQPGTVIRISQRGMPKVDQPRIRGDLHLVVKVTVPEKLSSEAIESLKAFQAIQERSRFASIRPINSRTHSPKDTSDVSRLKCGFNGAS